MMVAKPEIPPSQMMNIAKVLLHLDSSHYSLYTHYTYDINFSSIGVHVSMQKRLGSQLSSWNTQLTSSCIGQDIQISYNKFFV